MSRALRLAAGLGLILLWIVPVAEYLALPWVVVGPSMEPTLLHGQRVIVDRWTYDRRPPRPGEIALVEDDDGRLIVKRVGVPPVDRRGNAGLVWVYGDNRRASDDSRRFGPVAVGRVRGRVVARLWPPSWPGPPPSD